MSVVCVFNSVKSLREDGKGRGVGGQKIRYLRKMRKRKTTTTTVILVAREDRRLR